MVAEIAFIVLLFGLIFLISILGIVLWIFMLIDAAKRKFKNENEKVAWIIILALTSWIGAIIYYFAVKSPDRR